jgi:uncharacterized protein (TIGR02996 family)
MKDARAGFWKAILAEPDEDVNRLVYADWLDDHGEAEHAEFIRVQCELARLPVGDARRVELEVRAGVLLQEHRDAWLAGLPKWVKRDYVTFRRGFPWSVNTTRKAFLRNASALAARTVIQEATLDAVAKEEIEGIAGLPVAGRLRSIRTWSSSFAELHDLLTACTGLTALALFNTCDGPDAGDRLAALLALPSVRGATHFTFRLRDEGEVARRAVETVAATELANIQTLGLDIHGLSRETLEVLLRAPFVRGLKALALTSRFDARALEMLGATAGLAALRSLRLFLAEGAGAELAKLAGSPYLSGLTDLCLAGPEAECAAALDSDLTERLRTLELWSWNSTGGKRVQVVQQLAESGRLVCLVRLRVRDHDFADADTSALASSPHLPALVHLELDKSQATEHSLEALARSPHFPALRAVTALPHLVSVRGIDADALRALNARFASRFAVLVPPPGWGSCSPEDLRLGAY